MRKAFNFYRSYFDVVKELPEKDKLAFLMAILEKQFEGKEPNLKGLSQFAYISQKHSIDSQVAGYETKTGIKITPTDGGTQGGTEGASVQGEGKEKVEEKVKLTIFLETFDTFRKEYLGTKRGNETEFKNFQKHSDWKTVLPTLLNILKAQKENRNSKKQRNEFVPEWKNLQTWINQRCWEEVTGQTKQENKSIYSHYPEIGKDV